MPTALYLRHARLRMMRIMPPDSVAAESQSGGPAARYNSAIKSLASRAGATNDRTGAGASRRTGTGAEQLAAGGTISHRLFARGDRSGRVGDSPVHRFLAGAGASNDRRDRGLCAFGPRVEQGRIF